MRKITIDPGIGGTGWAIWSKNWELKSWGQIIPKDKKNSFDALSSICGNLKLICSESEVAVTTVYIEYPQVFRHDIALSGALTKLAFGVGVIAGSLLPRKFELIEVLKWKGNLPKEVVAKRVQKRLPGLKFDNHVYDAIGIGLYLRGEF